jgi:hypothetical protein
MPPSNAVGVTASFNPLESRRDALNIPAEMKNLVNKLSQAYYTLGDVFLHGQTDQRRRRSIAGSCGDSRPADEPDVRPDRDIVEQVHRRGRTETDVRPLYWTYGNWAAR